MKPSPTIDEVRRFWTEHPLFAGEGHSAVGDREWFLEHERVYMNDVFAGEVPAIFSKDVVAQTNCWSRMRSRHMGATLLGAVVDCGRAT